MRYSVQETIHCIGVRICFAGRVSLCLLTVWLFLACVGRGEIVPIPSWSKSMAKEKYIGAYAAALGGVDIVVFTL